MVYFSQLIKSIKSEIFHSPTISIIGPSGAGKTTFMEFLHTGKEQTEEPSPTIGLMYRKEPYKVDNWEFNIIDVGGQDIYRQSLWELAIEQSEIVVYMIDATIKPDDDYNDIFQKDVDRFKFTANLLQDDQFVLILLNKQDLSELKPLKLKDFKQVYPTKHMLSAKYDIIETSAKFGFGIKKCFESIIKNLEANKN